MSENKEYGNMVLRTVVGFQTQTVAQGMKKMIMYV
jgi:hypothetical protein